MDAPQPNYMVRQHVRVCAEKGFPIPAGGRVLDFGCGSGDLVYAYRDSGYDAVGFDICETVCLRASEDRRYFSILPSEISRPAERGVTDYTVDWQRFRLPYANATFDFVFSSETIEHVKDHRPVLREIARVLKPRAASIHTFPPKFKLIEPHILVPGGTLFQSRLYFLFWALLGVRNQFQKGFGPWETAKENARYAKGCLNYVAPSRLRRFGSRWFGVSEFVPALWHAGQRDLPSALSRALCTHTIHTVWFLALPHK